MQSPPTSDSSKPPNKALIWFTLFLFAVILAIGVWTFHPTENPDQARTSPSVPKP